MKKCVILTGAGAAYPWKINGKPVNSQSITEKIISENSFLEKLISSIVARYEGKYDVNFETILHILETLYLYYRGKKSPIDFVPSVLFNLADEIIEMGGISDSDDPSTLMSVYYKDAIFLIRNEIYKYDNLIKIDFHPSLNSQLSRFIDSIVKNEFIIRGYTTNYDQMLIDCGSESIKFFDGTTPRLDNQNILFDPGINDFNIQEIHSFDNHCFYNLHGSIYWNNIPEYFNSLNKSSFYLERNFNFTIRIESEESNPKEPILLSPIITGYNKVQRVYFEPFHAISNSFYKDCLNADCFIFIGFSFSDPYITNVIRNANIQNKRVLIVDPNPSPLINYLKLDNPCPFFDGKLLKYSDNVWQYEDGFEEFLQISEEILNDFLI